MLATSWLDWKLGGRMLLKYPGLSVIAVITLAVAIGLGAGWFEVTRQIIDPRIPLPDGDRIVRIDNWDAAESEVEPRSLYDFQLWREQLTAIRELGAYRAFERNLITPDGIAYPTAVAEISASAFPLARVQPLLGRALMDSDAEPGAPDVVVIGYDVWQRRFSGDRGVLGQTVRLGRTPATIVGVMPDGFAFPIDHQLWVPLRVTNAAPRNGPYISVFGRLADGENLTSAQAELTTIGQRVAALQPATHAQLRPRVSSYAAPSPGSREPAMLRLSNLIGLLILIVACSNVATLLFARTATREAEIVVRNALGASRARVMMQLFVEAFVVCAVATVVGLTAVSFAFEHVVDMFLQSEQDAQLPFWWQFTISPATVGYAALLALCGAALVAVLPAIKATGPRVQSALTMAASGSTSMRFGGVWSVMIVLQVATAALCLPLGVFAAYWGLRDPLARSAYPTREYLTFRPELDRDAVLTATGELGAAEYRAHLSNVYEELKRRLARESTVAGVTFGSALPGTYHPLSQIEAQRGTEPPVVVDAHIESDLVRTASVDIGYFDTFRLPLLAGRAFHAGDVAAQNVVIINETLARNIGGNPLGVRLRHVERGTGEPASPWYEVVGVVRGPGLQVPEPDGVYLPTSVADASPLILAIQVRGDAASVGPRVTALAAQVEPGLRLRAMLALDEVVRRHDRADFAGALGVGAVTLLMMVLSAAGLYSLMAVAVTRRTREIGIRLAIGASPRAVLAALFKRASIQVGVGIVIAVGLLPSLMSAIGISELPIRFVVSTMLIASGGMLLVGVLACGVPARRALRIQPTEAVRYGG